MQENRPLGITYGGGETDWFRFGSGEKTLAIIPGMSIKPISHSAEAIAAAFADFAADRTVYVFGRGRKVREDVSIETLAADVAEAMDGLGLRGADVFAVSLGGMIALRLALTRPELVRSLALESPREGDVLAFRNAGAYAVTEGVALLLSRTLPRVIMRDGAGTCALGRDFTETSPLNTL